ncbi:MAG TPA: glycosyltransferase family 2 protein [Sphingomonadaceae bacterium]|nr:glycosyltransferase family 2 protein [Sphingomonadaceae bacterium]
MTIAHEAAGAACLPAELAIVVPAFNERRNVALLIAAVSQALGSIRWEMVFVDDNSPDGTADEVRAIALADPRVRIVHRFGRRGLATACIEGIMATAAPYVAVMDADLQHDESILPEMFRRLTTEDVDLVVGSRYMAGGGTGEWAPGRVRMSRIATCMATRLTRTPISDPMSGFFMLKRDAFLRSLPSLSSVGFKILLDIAASAPAPLKVAEVPFTFRTRRHGESKLDTLVLWEYFQLLLDKTFGRYVPVRFISFALVGGFGVFVHFFVLALLFKGFAVRFMVAQAAATMVAISNNFLLNNILTYRDQRLRGYRLFRGWLSFNLICLTGATANVGIADWLFTHRSDWILSALAGIAIGVVWNYAMSSIFTWRKR